VEDAGERQLDGVHAALAREKADVLGKAARRRHACQDLLPRLEADERAAPLLGTVELMMRRDRHVHVERGLPELVVFGRWIALAAGKDAQVHALQPHLSA